MKALRTQVILCFVSLVAVVQVHSKGDIQKVSERSSKFQSSQFSFSSSSDKEEEQLTRVEERFSSIKEQDFFERDFALSKDQDISLFKSQGPEAITEKEIIKREESSIIKREESSLISNQELFQREESLLMSDQEYSSFKQQQQPSLFKEPEILSLIDLDVQNMRFNGNNMTTLNISENIFSNARYATQLSNISESRNNRLNSTIVKPGPKSINQTTAKPISGKDKDKTIEVIETISTASSSANAQVFVVKKEEEEIINDDGSVTIEEIENVTQSSKAAASQTSVMMRQKNMSDRQNNSEQATTATETATSTSASNTYQSSQSKPGKKGKGRPHARPLPHHPTYLQLRPNQEPLPKIPITPSFKNQGSSAITEQEIIKREESSIIKREESSLISNQELFQREGSLLISDQESTSFKQQQQSLSFKEQEILSLFDQELQNMRFNGNNKTTLNRSENIFNNAGYATQLSNISASKNNRLNSTIVKPEPKSTNQKTAKPISGKDKYKTIEFLETISTASSSANAQVFVVKKEEEARINDDGSVTIEEIENVTQSSKAAASQTSMMMRQENTPDRQNNSEQATTATETATSTSASNTYQSSQSKSRKKGKGRLHARPLPHHPTYLQLCPNQQPLPKIPPQPLLALSSNPESVWFNGLPDPSNNGQSYYVESKSQQQESRDCKIYDIITKKNDRVGKALQADLKINFRFYDDGKNDQCQCTCGPKKKPFYITVDMDKIKDYQLN